MDLNISKMEQFSKVQIECLEMMNELIAYDKEEAVKGTQAEFIGFEKTGENKYLKKVSNDTEIFSLGTLVKVDSKSSWIASYDVSCTKIILTKIVELSVGDNLCYVNVTDENGNMSLYTLNILSLIHI